MSSDVSTGSWAPSVEQLLTHVPDEASGEPAAAQTVPIHSQGMQQEADATIGQVSSRRSNGLKACLFSLDVATVAATWLVLGVLDVPATAADRRWIAVAAAIIVTLGAARFLGLYRSRLCAQRGQETARILVAVLAAAVVFIVLSGGGTRRIGAVIVAAASCFLALITVRWVFGQWLSAQRARGRFRRGIVMVGSNDDAVDVWTMLHSQPELGYEVRGIVGRPRSHPDWVGMPNGLTVERIPDLARLTDSSGVLVVANALCAAEVGRVIELCTAHGLHVQVCPGFRGLATRRVRQVPLSGEAFLYLESGRRPTGNWWSSEPSICSER